ncbi:MAG TPA: DUF488 domain-containing protein [Pyrinomonadaceae bacterium]
MRLLTIGFTKKSAREFFTKLMDVGVKRVVDVRLNNTSTLAGFSKKNDLEYFLEAVGGIEYIHLTELAPTQDLLDAYKKQRGDWAVYERGFLNLMQSRAIEQRLRDVLREGDCLLCSEERPDHCHRRLVAEYLKQKWDNVEINHIV